MMDQTDLQEAGLLKTPTVTLVSRLRFLGQIALLFLIPSVSCAYQTVYNPFTGRLDYVGISTNAVAGQVILNQSALQSGSTFHVSSGTVQQKLTSGPITILEDGGFNALNGFSLGTCTPAFWSLNSTTLTLGDASGICGTSSEILLNDGGTSQVTTITPGDIITPFVELTNLSASQFVKTDTSKNTVSFDLFGGSNTFTGNDTFTSSMTVTGGINLSSGVAVTVPSGIVSSSMTLTSTMSVVMSSCSPSGPNITSWITLTLPSASSFLGSDIIIYKVDSSSCQIRIAGSGNDLIESTGTVTLNAKFQHASLHSLGSVGWGSGLGGIQATPHFVGPGFQSNTANTIGTSSVAICGAFSTLVPVLIDSITVHVGVAGSPAANIDVGIYDTSGNRLASNGGSSTNNMSGKVGFNMSTPLQTPPGSYWMCLTLSNTITTLHSATGSTTQFNGYQSCTGTNYPLPATLPFPCGNTTRLVDYNMWGHVAGGTP